MMVRRPITRRIVRLARALSRSRRASSAVEYALILTLIALAALAAIADVGGINAAIWGDVHTRVSTSSAAATS